MALTQISTAGVKDDAVTAGKIPANAVGSSELADNAVDTAAIADDAVTSAKIAKPIDLADNEKIRLGTGNDLEIYFNGTNSVISHIPNSGDLIFQAPTGETSIRCNASSAVELYHDNVKRFETDSNGARVVAPEGEQAILRLIGDEGDDANDSFRLNAGGGTLKIQDASNQSSWEDNIVINAAGSVELYHDNAKKLETWAGGIKLNGVENAGSQLMIGASNDFAIEHDGSNTYLANSTGDLVLQNDANVKITAKAGGTQRFRFDTDGLKFGTDTAAANALDDYEEGTWTVSLLSGGSSITNQPANNRYVKIGSMVYITGEISSLVSPNSDILQIGGLPYAIAQGREGTGSCMSHHVTYGTNRTMITLYVYDNSSKFRFYSSGNATSWRAITGDDFSTSGDIIFSFAYHTV